MKLERERLQKHWLVGCESRRLKNSPVGITVLGTPLVVYRSHGAIVAAEDRCPHRNAPLSRGSLHDGKLRCPYHGWSFGAQGECVAAPGLGLGELPCVSLNRWDVQEREGWIWVAKSVVNEVQTPYRPKIAADAAYRGFSMTAKLDANLLDAIENLLDGTHTPFVHAGLVRSSKTQQTFSALVQRRDDYIEAEYRGESRQSGFISRWFESDRDVSFGRFIPPCTAELEYRSRSRVELLVVAHFTRQAMGRFKSTCDAICQMVDCQLLGVSPSWVRSSAEF